MSARRWVVKVGSYLVNVGRTPETQPQYGYLFSRSVNKAHKFTSLASARRQARAHDYAPPWKKAFAVPVECIGGKWKVVRLVTKPNSPRGAPPQSELKTDPLKLWASSASALLCFLRDEADVSDHVRGRARSLCLELFDIRQNEAASERAVGVEQFDKPGGALPGRERRDWARLWKMVARSCRRDAFLHCSMWNGAVDQIEKKQADIERLTRERDYARTNIRLIRSLLIGHPNAHDAVVADIGRWDAEVPEPSDERVEIDQETLDLIFPPEPSTASPPATEPEGNGLFCDDSYSPEEQADIYLAMKAKSAAASPPGGVGGPRERVLAFIEGRQVGYSRGLQRAAELCASKFRCGCGEAIRSELEKGEPR